MAKKQHSSHTAFHSFQDMIVTVTLKTNSEIRYSYTIQSDNTERYSDTSNSDCDSDSKREIDISDIDIDFLVAVDAWTANN